MLQGPQAGPPSLRKVCAGFARSGCAERKGSVMESRPRPSAATGRGRPVRLLGQPASRPGTRSAVAWPPAGWERKRPATHQRQSMGCGVSHS